MYYPVIDLKETIRKYDSRYQYIYFDIVQIGAGGNGGYLLQRLSKMLYSFTQSNKQFDFRYTVVDGDAVEEKNLRRQPFILEDLHQIKSKILAERYSSAYQIPIFYEEEYVESSEHVLRLFHKKYSEKFYLPILIGCVDNNATRQILHQVFEQSYSMIYIDSGIDGVLIEGTEEEIEESGYSGHVVCGCKICDHILLEPVGEVYSNILEDKDSRLPTQACGETVVYYPQRMQTNETAALVMAGYLNTILGDNKIVSHYTNFNARTMLIRPTYISEE